MVLQGGEQSLDRTRGGEEREYPGYPPSNGEVGFEIQENVYKHSCDFWAHLFQGGARSGHHFVPRKQVDQQGSQFPTPGSISEAARTTRDESPDRRSITETTSASVGAAEC